MAMRPDNQFQQRPTGQGPAEDTAGSDAAFYDLLSKERREQTVPIPELATQQFRKKMTGDLNESSGKGRSLNPKKLYKTVSSGLKRVRIIPALPRLPSLPEPIMRIISRQRTVTISLEKDAVRVVVFKGNYIIDWKSASIAGQEQLTGVAPTTAADVQDQDNLSESQVSSPLQQVLTQLGIHKSGQIGRILNKFGIRRGRLVMDLSLYITLMRRLQITSRVQGHYLRPVVMSEILESIPFDEEEVDIRWNLHKNEEGHEVFAVALPKNKIDSQVEMVKETAMPPTAAYSKAAVLALVAGVPNAVVVHTESSSAAVVLVLDHEPKMVHQIQLSRGDSSQEQAEALAKAVDQVASYHLSFDIRESEQPLPIILTGEDAADDKPLAIGLRNNLRHEIAEFKTLFQIPEGFPAAEYAANLGLFLVDKAKKRTQVGGTQAKRLSLNLLPSRHALKPFPIFQTIIFVTLALLAVHPANVSGWVDGKMQEATESTRELKSIQKQERDYNLRLAKYNKGENEMEQVTTRILELQSRLDTLKSGAENLVARLDIVTNTALPPQVGLSGVIPQGQGYVLAGSTNNYPNAFAYAANLEASPYFTDEVKVLEIKGSPTGVNFSFKVETQDPLEAALADVEAAEDAPKDTSAETQ